MHGYCGDMRIATGLTYILLSCSLSGRCLQIMLSLNSKSGLTIGQTILRILGVRRFSFVVSVDNTLSVELIGYAGMPNVSFVRLHIRGMKSNNTHSYPRTSLHYSIIKEGGSNSLQY
jgi:hypothetical protein